MACHRFRLGDHVIFRMNKHNVRPGRRAKNIQAAPRGETYTYQVDKFWTVQEARENGTLLLVTRRGKHNIVDADDPNLRTPRWWERVIYFNRFPELPSPETRLAAKSV